MASKFLQVFMGNARYECERTLPSVINHQVSFKQILEFCRGYRLLGIGMLFMFGEADALHAYLHKSGRAFLHFLSVADEESKVTSRFKPFFDAIACLDLDGAREIALRARAVRSDVEYEEDFLYVQFLMTRFFRHRSDHDEQQILDRYEQALQGASDPRLDICKALFVKDDSLFDDALARFLDEVEARYAKLAERELALEEELATEGRLSVEGLALIVLAERAGVKLRPDYLFIPSMARPTAPPSDPPESWMKVAD